MTTYPTPPRHGMSPEEIRRDQAEHWTKSADEVKPEADYIPPVELIVTRHQAMVDYIASGEAGIQLRTPEAGGYRVISHATPEDVRGRRVCGVLPLHLAAETAMITVVPLFLPPELRNVELDLEHVKRFAGRPQSYKVENVQ